ncbi:hypothetical protein Bca52824_011034 [Brassica carinata]|uniref:Uncharacterized protein n=1 Tax=Brassica carinata TaxID=52824 RepID=A0A8X7WDW1_BRACI|nr:hypothetical protein Bca52824_011034 [Brassica carinata]
MAKYVLILGHAKEMDVKCQVPVRSILNDLDEEWGIGKDFAWDDETNDTAVDTFVRLIQECFVFRREMFKGGLTTAEISRMRGEKLKEKEAKEHQEKEKQDKENANDPKEADVSERRTRGASGVNILAGQVREELLGMDARVPAAFESHVETIVGRFGFEKKISDLQKAVSALNEIEGMVNSNISGAVKDMQESVTKSILDFLRNPISSAPPGPFSSPSGSGSGESQHEDNADRTDNATDEAGIGKDLSQSASDRANNLRVIMERLGISLPNPPEPVREVPTQAVEETVEDVEITHLDHEGGDGTEQQPAQAQPEESSESHDQDEILEAETQMGERSEGNEAEPEQIQLRRSTRNRKPASNWINTKVYFNDEAVAHPISVVEDPTFSLGVTQEDSHGTFVIANSGVTCSLGTISTHILTRGERVKEPASNRRFSKIFSATRTLVSHM